MTENEKVNQTQPGETTKPSFYKNKKILFPAIGAGVLVVVLLLVFVFTSGGSNDSPQKHNQAQTNSKYDSNGKYKFTTMDQCIIDIRPHAKSEQDAFEQCRNIEYEQKSQQQTSKGGFEPIPVDCKPQDENQWYRTDSTFVVDPTNNKTMYVNVEYKGFYKSTDGGQTWTKKVKGIVTDHQDMNTSEPCYSEYPVAVIDPTNPKRLLLATSGGGGGTIKDMNMRGGGVYETTNGGDSWKQKITDKMNGYVTHALVLDPKNPKIWYYGTSASPASYTEADPNKIWVTKGIIYKTSDNGKKWEELPTGFKKFDRMIFIAVNPDKPNTITAASVLMVHSADGPNKIGSEQSGYIQSTDGGKTWKRIDNLAPGDSGPSEAAASPTNGNKFFHITATNGGIPSKSFYSVDGAKTFTQANLSLDFARYDPNVKDGSRLVGYKWQCQQGPCSMTLHESTDSGATWHSFGSLPSEITNLQDHKTRIQNIVWDPKDKNTIYMTGANGYVWKSTNNASSWQTLLSVDKLAKS